MQKAAKKRTASRKLIKQRKEYDPQERAQRYHRNKYKIALKNGRKKDERARKYQENNR